MIRRVKLTALAVLLLTTAACPRNVQVESEPNRFEAAAATAPAEIDVVGVYDYRVEAGGDVITGPMTVSRTADGGYAVRFVMNDGNEVPTRNVRRNGDTLSMDATTPGGDGTVTLRWTDANTVEGDVFIGEFIPIHASRRQ